MQRRDKLILTGVGALLLGLGAAAVFYDEGAADGSAERTEIIRPVAEKNTDQKDFGSLTKDRLARIPEPEEVPQEFKEAENYLLDRWGHMEDAGLVAPGIMPEGDMYFQNRRIIRGVRGNGKPIFAKAFLRPERFRGPSIKANNGMAAIAERNPSASIPGRTEAVARANVKRFAKQSGLSANKGTIQNKVRTLEDMPQSSYGSGKRGGSDAAGSKTGSGDGATDAGSQGN